MAIMEFFLYSLYNTFVKLNKLHFIPLSNLDFVCNNFEEYNCTSIKISEQVCSHLHFMVKKEILYSFILKIIT